MVLGRAFRERTARKIYWAVVVGVPEPVRGRIDLPLSKRADDKGERVRGLVDGDPAITDYSVVERAGRHAAWVELSPLTGRTHQLRVHCAAVGTPILGDGKYGGRAAFLKDAADTRALHLHARRITISHPSGGTLTVEAPLPDHMRQTWRRLGFTDPAIQPPRHQRKGVTRSGVPAVKHGHQRRQDDDRARQRQADGDRQEKPHAGDPRMGRQRQRAERANRRQRAEDDGARGA
jgi:23S rRNA pseudouridine955/2504/2580 synthase